MAIVRAYIYSSRPVCLLVFQVLRDRTCPQQFYSTLGIPPPIADGNDCLYRSVSVLINKVVRLGNSAIYMN